MDELLDLSARGVLITGGCGALGRAIVARLREHGAGVVVNDLLEPAEAAAVLPDGVHYIRGAVETEEDGARVFAAATRLLGAPPVNVLCHAGIVEAHPIDEYPLGTFDALMAANVRSAFVLAQASANGWRQEGAAGQLVFTSSWVAETPWPGIAPYSASKAALNALTRSFARELAAHGIRANAVAPGIVGAGMAKKQWDTEPDYRARAEKAIPLGRLQDLDSVANAFLFLCSPMSDYLTGSVLTVDGGASLYPMD
jgi:NAD(P)-dependent dehydrogenase (short-subunit alcohol dehydrogenase family)